MTTTGERSTAMAAARGGRRTRRPRWSPLFVTAGDGDPYGTYRMRQLVLFFWPGIAMSVGFVGLLGWVDISTNVEVGLPWSDSLLGDLPLALAVLALSPPLIW